MHLTQRGHRVGEVLEHLVGVHDVEARVGEVEGVHVAEHELDLGSALLVGRGAREGQRLLDVLDPDHPAR